jgi:hypothetical protein
MFAAIVPTLRQDIDRQSDCRTMNPMGMLVAKARGWEFGPANNLLLMHYPDYLLAGVAVISHVVEAGPEG